jgi:crossover junction endodeoxyribonuclease RuvC
MSKKKAHKQIDNEILLGLDPGIANFGWAVHYTDGTLNASGVIKTSVSVADHQRMLQIVRELNSVVKEYSIDCVIVEQMMLHNPVPAIIRGYGARMCVLAHLAELGLAYEEYNPTTTKKVLLGKGVADKNTMKKAVMEWFDFNERDGKLAEHEIDSFAQIAMFIKEEKINCPVYDRIKATTDKKRGNYKCKK